MTVQTDYYGTVEYDEEDLVIFEDGLFGFHHLTRFLPLFLKEDEDTMILLVSVEKPEVAFVLINPIILCPEYFPELSPEELSCLGVSDSGELSYYAICVVKKDYVENTVNLKCPLAINPITRRGMQVILEQSHYEFRHLFRSFPSIAAAVTNEERGIEYANSEA